MRRIVACTAESRAHRDFGTRAPSDEGFTIVEVMVAIGILFLVLVTMAYSATLALVDVGHSRQRQGAASLANQAIEQVRALPFAQVVQGLSNADLASGSDPNITSTAAPLTYRYKGEEIPRSTPATNEPRPPLMPSHRNAVRVGTTDYVIAAYPTFTAGGVAVRLTVEVSWARSLRGTRASKIQAQTILSPGTGCTGSTATSPYAAPCPAALAGESGIGGGGIIIQPAPTGITSDVDLESASLDLGSLQSILSASQVTSIQGTARTAGVRFKALSGDPAALDELVATAATSTDPAAARPPYDSSSSTVVNQGGTLPSLRPPGSNSVWVTSSIADTRAAISTISGDGTTRPCVNPNGYDEADHQPCGSLRGRQFGTLTAGATLPDGSNVTLASVGSSTDETRAYTHKRVATASTTCSLGGCIETSATRRLGTVRLGAVPAGCEPSGGSWTGSAVQLSNFSDSVSAAAGDGAAVPSASSTGGIRYWNGSGYSDIAVNNPGVTSFSTEVHETCGAYRVDIVGSFTLGAPTTNTTVTPEFPLRRLSASATSPSPLQGTLTYRISTDSVAVLDLVLDVNLGTLSADASYAP